MLENSRENLLLIFVALRDQVSDVLSLVDQYYIVIPNLSQLVAMSLLVFIFTALFSLLYWHPLFLVGKQLFFVPLNWKKIRTKFKLEATAKAMAEQEHFRFSPIIDLVLYKHPQGYMNTVELIKCGKKKYILLVKEDKLQLFYDNLLSKLMCPKKKISNFLLFFNTAAILLSNYFMSLQSLIFYNVKKIKHKDVKNFFQVCLYLLFLPIIYTRLSVRSYFYKKLFLNTYGEEVTRELLVDINNELNRFLSKPVSYFFWLIHEKV